MPSSEIARLSTVVASRWANDVAGAGSVRSSAGTYTAWARTRDWLPEFSPGAFTLAIDNACGTPLGVQAWFSYFLTDPANIRNKPENGGGGLLDIGCYPIATSRFVLDAEPRRVVATAEIDPTFGTDVLTSALIDYGDGRHLTFSVSTRSVPHQRVNVIGTEGRIEVMIPFNAPAMAETVIRIDDGAALGDAGIETIVIPACDQYGLEGEAFAKAVRGIEPLAYDQRDAVQMMTILDAIAASARQGGWVAID